MTMHVQPFAYEDHLVRTVMIDDVPWFVAKDVCGVLGIANSRQAVENLDAEEKGVSNTYTLGGRQELTIISESGLYALVFKSRRPEAKKFRKWVTSEVLPALRRTGKYEMPSPEPMSAAFPEPMSSELYASVALVREARLTKGRAFAQAVWKQLELPGHEMLRQELAGPDAGPEDEAYECLNDILDAPVHGGVVRDLVGRAADGDPAAARALPQIGLMWADDHARRGLIVANTHAGLATLMKGTRWHSSRWRDALGGLPGVERTPNRPRFGQQQSRAWFIPADVALVELSTCNA